MITAHQVLHAYTQGVFPMADPDTDEIFWYEPKIRGVVFLDDVNIPKTVKKELNSGKFECRMNHDFSGVMKACAQRDETWISDEIIEVYTGLHNMGYGYSFETYYEGQLVGGLYGVAMEKIFFGESMFHHMTNASKVAFAFCIETLQENGYRMIDTQYATNHLKQFNTIEIPQQEYMKELIHCLQ
ncbi:leucyl/phenylalanyl-tRNA--protein transferase [Bacteroidia bacterium]|nr:leucyl/phenylalanyl-tRNA--protein transferase [Bacteroidia bacterium]